MPATWLDVAADVRAPVALHAIQFRILGKMTEHSLWRFSRAWHRAINERQFDELDAIIDEDVDWAVYGPIDMFPFLGARHGKEAVIEAIRQIADNVTIRKFERERVLLGVD